MGAGILRAVSRIKPSPHRRLLGTRLERLDEVTYLADVVVQMRRTDKEETESGLDGRLFDDRRRE